MTGFRRCLVAAVALLGATNLASATVIQYQPHDQQRGVIIGSEGDFVDQLGLWVGQKADGTQSASQLSLLGPQIVFGSNEVTGPDAASVMDVRFGVNNDTPFELSFSASGLGALLVLRDLTTSTNLVLFTPFGQASQTFTGQLTAGHDFSLLTALQSPFGSTATSEVFFSIHQDDEESLTLIPAPGASAVLAFAGLAVCSRRRRA